MDACRWQSRISKNSRKTFSSISWATADTGTANKTSLTTLIQKCTTLSRTTHQCSTCTQRSAFKKEYWLKSKSRKCKNSLWVSMKKPTKKSLMILLMTSRNTKILTTSWRKYPIRSIRQECPKILLRNCLKKSALGLIVLTFIQRSRKSLTSGLRISHRAKIWTGPQCRASPLVRLWMKALELGFQARMLSAEHFLTGMHTFQTKRETWRNWTFTSPLTLRKSRFATVTWVSMAYAGMSTGTRSQIQMF